MEGPDRSYSIRSKLLGLRLCLGYTKTYFWSRPGRESSYEQNTTVHTPLGCMPCTAGKWFVDALCLARCILRDPTWIHPTFRVSTPVQSQNADGTYAQKSFDSAGLLSPDSHRVGHRSHRAVPLSRSQVKLNSRCL